MHCIDVRYGLGCFRESYLDQGRIFYNNVQMSEKSQLNHEKSKLIRLVQGKQNLRPTCPKGKLEFKPLLQLHTRF